MTYHLRLNSITCRAWGTVRSPMEGNRHCRRTYSRSDGGPDAKHRRGGTVRSPNPRGRRRRCTDRGRTVGPTLKNIMELKTVRVHIPEGANIVVGQTHFIKTIEDLYEILV